MAQDKKTSRSGEREESSFSIDDFLGAINTGALVPDESNSLRVNIGQLYMVLDNTAEGIRQMEIALNNGATLTASLAKLLAQAHAQEERWQEERNLSLSQIGETDLEASEELSGLTL